MFVGYCRDSYSKCMHCSITLQKHNVIFFQGEEPEVNCSNFMNFERKIASDGVITIYIPRAFQQAAPHPLILQHVEKAQL